MMLQFGTKSSNEFKRHRCGEISAFRKIDRAGATAAYEHDDAPLPARWSDSREFCQANHSPVSEVHGLDPESSPRMIWPVVGQKIHTCAIATGAGSGVIVVLVRGVALARSIFRKGADFTAAMRLNALRRTWSPN